MDLNKATSIEQNYNLQKKQFQRNNNYEEIKNISQMEVQRAFEINRMWIEVMKKEIDKLESLKKEWDNL